MVKLALKFLLESKLRTLLTLIGIILPVSLIMILGIIQDTAKSQLISQVSQRNGKIDLIISTQGKFDLEELSWIKGQKEIISCSTRINIPHIIKNKNEDNIDLNLVGLNVNKEDKLKPLIIKEGRTISTNEMIHREVIISVSTSERLGKKLDDLLMIDSKGYRIVGIITNESEELANYKNNVYFPTSTMNKDFKLIENINEIRINAGQNEKNVAVLLKSIRSKYGDKFQINNVFSHYATVNEDIESFLTITYLILFIIIIASFCIVYNTYSVIVFKRMGNIGILRTLGMSKSASRNLWVVEGFLLGALGSLIGFLIGIPFAYILLSVVLKTPVPLTELHIPVSYTVTAVILGILTSVFSILKLNKKIHKLYPMEILIYSKNKELYLKDSIPVKRTIIGVILLICIPFSDLIVTDDPIGANGLEFTLILSGFLVLLPLFLKAYVFVTATINKSVWGAEGMLACRNLTRNMKNTMSILTISVLGIMLLIAFNIIVMSFEDNTVYFTNQTLKYDLMVNDEKSSLENIYEKIDILQRQKEVEDATVVSVKRYNDEKTQLWGEIYGIEPDRFRSMGSLGLIQGNEEACFQIMKNRTEYVVVSKKISDEYKLEIGDTYDFQVNNKNLSMKVLGICNTFEGNGYVIFMNKNHMGSYLECDSNQILIKAKEATEVSLLEKKVRDVYGDQGVAISTKKQIVELLRRDIVKSNELMDIILYIVLMIAIFILVNTLILSNYERCSEIGLMRSIGADISSIKKIVVIETLNIGILSILLGVAGGVTLGGSFTKLVAATTSFNILFISYPVKYTLFVCLAVLASMIIAALLPAHIAGKTDIMKAIKHE